MIRVRPVILGMAAVLLAIAVVVPATVAGGRPFSMALTGAAEAPGPGDPDGSGSAQLWINPGTGTVCWAIEVQGVAAITAAHIHVAPAGAPGPVVVPLNPYAGGCTQADPALARQIVRTPSAYYVNVHNTDFPAGALRGQLSRTP